jgi:hypothetical protein
MPSPQQLRQLGDVGGDAPGLVAGEQLGRLQWRKFIFNAATGPGRKPFQ